MRRRRLLAALLAVGAAAALPAFAQHGAQGYHRRFDDAEKWSKVFDDPERDAWQKPAEVIAALRLAPDALVADVGAGTGYFAVRLARALPQGKVFGVDVEPDMVRFLNERAAKERLGNLAAHLGGEGDPKLPSPVDLVLVVDTYHHISQRPRYFERLRAALKPGGRVAIVDFRLDSPTGPPPRHRIAPKVVAEEMTLAGYRELERHEFLPNQYFLVFAPR